MKAARRGQLDLSAASRRVVGEVDRPSRSAHRVTLSIRDHHEPVYQVDGKFAMAVRTHRVHAIDATLVRRSLREPMEFRNLVERGAFAQSLPHPGTVRKWLLDTLAEFHSESTHAGMLSSMTGPPSSTTSGHVCPPTLRARSAPICSCACWAAYASRSRADRDSI